ncbi:MAG: acetoacetate--CoA ligase [Xanthomonadales bacterium]|nr:acetoacetate--CoA ligase [Gammaproteobacteria bacterium]MBT8050369.1 acetoacetate--CoA ligase [Gammaproteobacteria bacterium]MBT8057409.1 acetoacetate--CoA ligase [Gammaproteobacteria bacterium]NNJ80134.1 acetoacetate--CoA ligase [Xanthomonadales bacterium]NNL04589.1 acetoacetate--CoA ligase [Xanthomonadales bacterium]
MTENGQEPLWSPGPVRRQTANIRRFMELARRELDPSIYQYPDLHRFSIEHPRQFWRAVWDFCEVVGHPGNAVVERFDRFPGARWFPEARLNFAENLLRHRDDRPALLFRSENGEQAQYSYHELYLAVAKTAAALRLAGVETGDRVAGFLPNLPEAVIAMLAATSIGAIWSSCSPDFGIDGVTERFGQIGPKVLFCAAAHPYGGKQHNDLDKVRGIVEAIESIETVVVVPYPDENPQIDGIRNAVVFGEFTDNAAEQVEFERLPFDHPVYILYSSGTTGAPKCMTHGAGGTLLQHLKELVLHTNLRRQDRLCYFTTTGWMMWNWMVSGLAAGAALVLYDGSPFHPAPGALFDLVDECRISMLGVGAKAIAAWEKAGLVPRETHQLNSLVTLLSTGSPLAPDSFDYVYRDIKQNLCLSSIAGGSDIVSCFLPGCPLLPVYRGELQCAGLAMDVRVLREDGNEADVGETGELCCGQPFPAMPIGFWGDENDEKYHAAYFEKHPGFWAHGDFIRKTETGGYVIEGRSDATLNPGGVRIGTAEIYRQVEALNEVIESICVGQDWDDDVRVVLFVKLREGLLLDEALEARIRRAIRENTTPRHVPAKIIQVADIPRTLSGKIVELAVRDVIHGRPVANQDALANPSALELYRDLPQLRH